MAKRFDETVQIQRQNFSTGAAQGQLDLASHLEGFKNQATQRAAEQAVERGKQTAADIPIETGVNAQGQAVTIAPEKKKVGFIGSIESKAHNKALLGAYVSSVSNDIRENVARIAMANPDDIMAFNREVMSMKKGMVDGVDPAIRLETAAMLDNQITSTGIKVQQNNLKRDFALADSENVKNYEGSYDAMGLAWFEGDILAAGEHKASAVASVISRREAGAIDGPQAEREIHALDLEGIEQFQKGDLTRMAVELGEDAAIAEWQKRQATNMEGFNSRDEQDLIMAQVLADIHGAAARSSASKSENLAVLRNHLGVYENNNKLGYTTDPREEKMLIAEIIDSGDALLIERIGVTFQTKIFARGSRETRIAQLEQFNRLSSLTIAQSKLRDSFTASHDELEVLAEENILELALRQGLVKQEELGEIDFKGQEGAEMVLLNRERIGNTMGIHYKGRPDEGDILTGREELKLAEALPTMTATELVSLATSFQVVPTVWGEISDKGASVFAMAGATGDVTVMRQAFAGQQKIREGVAKLPDNIAGKFDNIFADETGGAYGPEDAGALKRTVEAVLADNFPTGNASKQDIIDAIQFVSGGIADFRGIKLEIPRGVGEHRFNRFADSDQAETVEAYGGAAFGRVEGQTFTEGIASERAAEMIRKATWKSEKTGGYSIWTNQGGQLMRRDDPTKPFIITWNSSIASKAISLSQLRGGSRREAMRARNILRNEEMRQAAAKFDRDNK